MTGKIGAILLAAGASTRLGKPKQLLQYQGSSLVRRAAQCLLDADCRPVVVVVGACAEVADEMSGLGVCVIQNERWAEGMASSIHAGLRAAREREPGLDAILIGVCDQPFVTGADLRALVKCFCESGSLIAAAQYGPTLGVPAVFGSQMFGDLMSLGGDTGARRILEKHRFDVAAFPLSNAEIDVDRAEDLGRLQ